MNLPENCVEYDEVIETVEIVVQGATGVANTFRIEVTKNVKGLDRQQAYSANCYRETNGIWVLDRDLPWVDETTQQAAKESAIRWAASALAK